MPSFEDLPLGAQKLGAVLVSLPRHPLDVGKPNYLLNLIGNFIAVPDIVLVSVAAEIADLAERGELRQQPRYPALAVMIDAALTMHDTLAALVSESASPRAADQ